MATEPTARPPVESAAQNGSERLTLSWSKWFRCESSFSLLLDPRDLVPLIRRKGTQ